jgi:ABC-type glycerol-3-phosphate transport system permease component
MTVISPTSPTIAVDVRAARRFSGPLGSNFTTYALLFLGSLAFLIPFYFILNGSLKTSAAVQAGDFIRPPKSLTDIQLANYPLALSKDKMDFWPALSNTVVITTCCVAGQIL